MQRDKFCEPVSTEDDWKLEFLVTFSQFLRSWKSISSEKTRSGLSIPTFMSMIHTTEAMIALCKHLLVKKNFQYVLTGQIMSDPIEKRYIIADIFKNEKIKLIFSSMLKTYFAYI